MSGYISAAAAVIGTAISAVGSYQSAQAQKQQAEFQSDMAMRNAETAELNAQRAEEEGRDAKRVGYENMVKKRQEAAGIIATQRAVAGASGAQVDSGSFMDMQLDTAEKGELDALQLFEQGKQQQYNKRVESWGYRDQGTGLQLQSNLYTNAASSYSPLLSGGSSLLSGLAKAGSSYYKMK